MRLTTSNNGRSVLQRRVPLAGQGRLGPTRVVQWFMDRDADLALHDLDQRRYQIKRSGKMMVEFFSTAVTFTPQRSVCCMPLSPTYSGSSKAADQPQEQGAVALDQQFERALISAVRSLDQDVIRQVRG